MMQLAQLENRIRRTIYGRHLVAWYDPAFRLPLSMLEGHVGIEPRRADFAAWYLLESGALRSTQLRAPGRVSYTDLARVHTREYLEALFSDPEVLARMFAAEPGEINAEELMHSVRISCGATIEAARYALHFRAHTLNLSGGFHHAAPDHGGGFCPVNDIAVSVAVLRHEGFRGRVVVLDLDAHPPDGTALCLEKDRASWIGSLSGSDWGGMPNVEEVLLPPGCTDEAYLKALSGLLAKMPTPKLAFVIAGGDVLAGDRMGRLGLSLKGARERDRRVEQALRGVPTVWLPGGGYHADSWKVLAGTGLLLATRSSRPIPEGYDPLRARFSAISAGLDPKTLSGELTFTEEDLGELWGYQPQKPFRLLGFYTREGLEYAFFQFGILEHVRRLGYRDLRIALDKVDQGNRLRLFGKSGKEEHQLIECVLEKREIGGAPVLYVHWLRLENPRARFSEARPRLPGQEAPGLGLAREISEMLALVARRLRLSGVALRPAWYHVAYTLRHHFRFLTPERQGRFLAMQRDLAGIPLREATLAIAEGRVTENGKPYTWEADEMVFWLSPPVAEEEAIKAEEARVHYAIQPVVS